LIESVLLYFVARETVHMRQFAGQSISSITAIELEDLFDLMTIISDAIKSVPSWIAIFTWNFLSFLLGLEKLNT